MAVNVNSVYTKVLYVLNKENRGYMTPAEFNSLAQQAQLEIFENYFQEINQQLRVDQPDFDYADRVQAIDEKIQLFKTFSTALYDNTTTPSNPYWTLPGAGATSADLSLYRLGTVTYKPNSGQSVELQRLQRTEFYNIELSPLTRSNKAFPTYLFENNRLYINPSSITNSSGTINVDYISKPTSPLWGYNVGTVGQYQYNPNNFDPVNQPTGSINFQLHNSEESTLVLKILAYAGIIINNLQVTQVADAMLSKQENNEKS